MSIDPRCRIRLDSVRMKDIEGATTDDIMTLALMQLQNAASLLVECGWHPVRGSKLARVVVRNAMDDEVQASSFH